MKIAIINASSYYQDKNGRVLISSDELKSLNQWFAIFDDVTLMKPERKESTKDVDDWMPLPESIKVKKLCDEKAGIKQKYAEIKLVAQNATDYDLFYYRLPNYEALFFWKSQNRGIPYFVELHGDMESAVMAGNKPYIIKKLMSIYLRNVFKEMATKAKFALSIGPVLLDKYVKSDIPTFATTNHLLVEADYPSEVQMKEIKGVINILFVGHIHNRKGLTYLFEALDKLHLEGKEFKLRIAGKGELRPQLEKYAQQHNFADRIEYLGQVKHGQALFDLYKQADIFILPSIAAEGVPRVTHEAMAFGCPVIATDIGSIRWQLDGGAGIVIPPFDSMAIYDAIVNVIENNGMRESLIKNGFEKSKQFSLEKQAEGIKQFVISHLKL